MLAVLIYVIIQVLRLPGIGSRSTIGIFFLFAVVCLMGDVFYWLIYDLVRAEIRMPVAANEIGEAAAFLLLSSELRSAFPEQTVSHKREIIGGVLFTAASIALWITWSGEWVQDIVGGAPFGYLICLCLIALKEADVLKRLEWLLLAGGSALLIVLQALAAYAPGRVSSASDLAAYLLMAAGEVLFLAKAFGLFRKDAGYRKLLAVSFSGFVFSSSCYFMSSEPWYEFHYLINALYIWLIFRAIRKEAAEKHDLC